MAESAPTDRLPADALRWLLTGVALVALALPLFGPVLDHHFAERQPHHVHVYLGGPVPDHVHPYETSGRRHNGHQHVHAPHDPGQNDGILFLTDHQGIGHGLAAVVSSLGQDASTVPGPDAVIRLNITGDGPAPRDALVRLPKKPPRV